MNLFDEQSDEYKESVLPSAVTKRLAVEMGATMSWYKYVGLNGDVMGIDHFGESGKGPEVIKHLGFTTENVVKAYEAL
jgi:transketolase